MNSTTYDVAIIGGGQAGLCLALQLKQADEDLQVLVVEKNSHPLPAAAHKVGESVVEISSYYMHKVLNLGSELALETRKFGLRFFFTANDNEDIRKRFELGPSHYLTVPAFHIDRGSFETNVARKCKAMGIDFIDNCRVSEIQIGANDQAHKLVLKHGENVMTIYCTWVVDASGRAGLLKRDLELSAPNRHNVNSVWFRIDHAFEIDTWCDDPDWLQRVREPRRLSTNHFFGAGYWLWFIPLVDGRTSVGLVADDRLHPFSEIGSLDKLMAWIERYEPQCAQLIEPQLEKVMDFRRLKNFSHDAKQVFSSQRWCLTGEAGLFLDPLYSPGGDFIAISNGFISELILRDKNGDDLTQLAKDYNDIYRRLYRIFLSVYHRQYPIMGNARVMSIKIVWDFAVYWGCVALLYCSNKLHDIAFMNRIDPTLKAYGATTVVMQAFFRDWLALDSGPATAGFLDYSEIGFLADLNAQLMEVPDDDDRVQALLERNLKLAKEIQQEIFAWVGDKIPELAQPTNVDSNHLGDIFDSLRPPLSHGTSSSER